MTSTHLDRAVVEKLFRVRQSKGEELLAVVAARGKALTDVALLRLLTHLQIAATPHGIPSSVRDRTPETADHPRQLVEAALALAAVPRVAGNPYVIPGKIEGRPTTITRKRFGSA